MDVRLPRLGEGADSGMVASIFVKEGDQINKDQPLLELESEKAVATIPSPEGGTVTKIHIREGDEIKVGQLIMTLAGDGKEVRGVAPPPPLVDASVGDEEAEVEGPVAGPPVGSVELPTLPPGGHMAVEGIPPAASPSIRKLARELGIDLTRIRGSERGGRIVMEDVRRYIQQLQQRAAVPTTAAAEARAAPTPAPVSIDFSRWGAIQRKKVSTLRRTISTKLAESWVVVPRVTQFDEVEITALLALKKKYDKKFEQKGVRLTLTALALKALVPVLKQYPVFNASLDEVAGEIVYKKYYHIGIAVDTEQGLIVPVLRDVDAKTLREVAAELGTLAERTRQRKVSLEEMQGASFTVSNQGGIGSGHFTPIVNLPQAAILGLGRGMAKPVVRAGRVAKGIVLPLSLSYDHRIIDGADAARFMVELVQALGEFAEAEIKAGL